MLIIPPTQSTTAVRTEVIPDVTKIWKVGQVMSAVAERNANVQDTILLRMGQSMLEAKTPVALNAGDQLKLIVKSIAGDTPVLKIQTASTSVPNRIVAQNLKSFIAQQKDLTSLLQLSQKIIDSPTIPRIIKQQLTNLHLQLPSAEQVTQAKTLKNIIQNSGVFLESKLNHQQKEAFKFGSLKQDDVKQDLKSQLLKITGELKTIAPELTIKSQVTTSKIHSVINQFIKGEINLVQLSTLLTNRLTTSQSQIVQQFLNTADKTLLSRELIGNFTTLLNHLRQQPMPQKLLSDLSSLLKTMGLLQELKTNVNGALAKITSQQLTTLTRETDNLLLQLFDLNLKDKDENHLIQFRLEEEEPAKDKDSSGWKISLNFNFKELGPFQANLHLKDNNISTVFSAEKDSTAKSISEQMDMLDKALTGIGFEAINLGVKQGSVSQPRDIPESVHMLDEKA